MDYTEEEVKKRIGFERIIVSDIQKTLDYFNSNPEADATWTLFLFRNKEGILEVKYTFMLNGIEMAAAGGYLMPKYSGIKENRA